MAIVQEFDLNMIPDSAPVIVHVNQYDEGEGRFEIHLYDGNVPYVPSAGAEAVIQGTKPDGKGFDYNATLDGSVVTADVTKQMTAVAGVVRTQVVITEGDNVTGTFVFGMDVQRSGLPADTDMSASEYQVVEQMIEAAEEAEEVATQSAEDAEAWAVGQRGGTDVPATDPAYHNNSKYYSEQAANSESAASDSAEDSEAWAVGERGGVPVTSGDPTYHNNAEYWADVARQSAGASVVANTETETSSHAYAVGDQFIYNGVLYTATASISIGGTITPGTNCTASDNIVDQLENKADLVGGKVPAAQLPSYVDDVIEGYYYNSKFYEEAAHTTEITPETGKIYVDLSTDVTYRWSGSAYIALSNPDIANDAVTAITASTAEYPVPAANELLKVIIGKINKFLDDLKTKKADKVSSAINGNFAGLDSSGNLTDSGMAPTEIQEKALTTDKRRVNIDLNTITTPGIYFVNKTDSGNYHYPDSLPYDRGTLTVVNYKDGDTDVCRQEFSMQECLYYRLGVLSGEYQGWNYWFEVSGGADGHEILNGSGTAMTQRGKLQFVGADVVDDGANDKTIITTTPQSMIGDAWADGVSYVAGDYRIDENVLYKCKTAHTSNSSNRPPSVSYWDEVSVSAELNNRGEWVELVKSIGTESQSTAIANWKSTVSKQYRYIAIVVLRASSGAGYGFNDDDNIGGLGVDIFPVSFLVGRTTYNTGTWITRTHPSTNGIYDFYVVSWMSNDSLNIYDNSTADALTGRHGIIIYGIK